MRQSSTYLDPISSLELGHTEKLLTGVGEWRRRAPLTKRNTLNAFSHPPSSSAPSNLLEPSTPALILCTFTCPPLPHRSVLPQVSLQLCIRIYCKRIPVFGESAANEFFVRECKTSKTKSTYLCNAPTTRIRSTI